MFCNNCNAIIPDTAIRCRNCGSMIQKGAGGSGLPGHKKQNQPPAQNQPPPQNYQPPQHYQQQSYQPPPPQYQHYPPSGPHYQGTNVNVVVPKQESSTFAILTLLGYILLFSYPLALLLNIIGMITGPKRGCFTQMFFVFFILPTVIIILLAVFAYSILEGIFDSISWF